MIGVVAGLNALLVATEFVVEGPIPLVSNLFRVGIFTRCVSTKSNPSAVRVKSELSARVI